MASEQKRLIIAAVRRVVFTGLILLGAWLLLTGLRGTIPPDVVEVMAAQSDSSIETVRELVYESDWSTSFWTGEPVTELIGARLGTTLQLVVFGALLSLTIASLLLFLGICISRITDQPLWLTRIRQVLRLILVSRGVSTPLFGVAALIMLYPAMWWGWSPASTSLTFSRWEVLFVSVLPAWFLVQAGHGELSELTGSYAMVARHLVVRLVTTLLKLTGMIIVITLLAERIFASPGLGRLIMESIFNRDYPVFFGVAWVFVLIVVLSKLIADLIGIAYDYFGKHVPSLEQAIEPSSPRFRIPKGWLIFCLVLIFLSIIVAFAGPAFAPYPMNEIHLRDRLQPPSAQYPLGTDNLGQDVLSELLYGIRTDITISLVCVGVLSVVAAGWAILAAYLKKANNWLGDTLEDLVMLPKDIVCAFPWLVLLLIPMSLMGRGVPQVSIVAGLVLLPHAVSMMREAYSSPPEGRGWLYSVLWSIPVMFILTVAGAILYISSLSYFGFGIPPGIPELGAMLSQEGRAYMEIAPWLALWPTILLALLTFIWVMAGDALLERLGFRSKAVWAKVYE